ncbi:hypothetical protein [Alteromonas macleodii]|uniref:hypothetical protein n=1 Tax=Alteromonas macleodii TaxID=28108 RepID=UPI0031401677
MEEKVFLTLPVALITGILSASVALVVVLINQYFLQRRSKIEFLREKLEEFYLVLIDIDELSSQRYSDFLESNKGADKIDWNASQNSIDLLYKKVHMYSFLYFRQVIPAYEYTFHYKTSLNEITYRFINLDSDRKPQFDEVCKRFANSHFALKGLTSLLAKNQDALAKGKKIKIPKDSQLD